LNYPHEGTKNVYYIRIQLLLFLAGVIWVPGVARAVPVSTEINQYLIVGMTSFGTATALDIQQTELGADQQVLSTYDPNTRDVFKPGQRWPDPFGATVDPPPPPAASIFEGIDWSGNVAVTSQTGKFSMSNTDVYANLGIHCATTPCNASVSNSQFFPDQQTTAAGNLPAVGVTTFNPAPLLGELAAWKLFIQDPLLLADATITSNIVNQNSLDGSGPYITNLADLNNDGVIVIDISIDGGKSDFELNNSDWILQGSQDVLAIFRIRGGSNFNLSNSSILLGDGGIGGGLSTDPVSRLGAIFFKGDEEGSSSGDTVFNFNNVVLNGIALWDLVTVGDTGTTRLTINDGQGCAQFISSAVDFDDVRWNRCSGGESQVPEPLSLILLAGGLAAIGAYRKLQQTKGRSA
jgi:hypothetical protein